MADKTRAERIEEAARDFYEETFAPEHDRHIVGALIGHRVLLGEALSLPPDPPRGDGWAALRELRDWIADEANGRGFTVDTVFNRIDRLLADAPKEPEPSYVTAAEDEIEAWRSESEAILRRYMDDCEASTGLPEPMWAMLGRAVGIMRRFSNQKEMP